MTVQILIRNALFKNISEQYLMLPAWELKKKTKTGTHEFLQNTEKGMNMPKITIKTEESFHLLAKFSVSLAIANSSTKVIIWCIPFRFLHPKWAKLNVKMLWGMATILVCSHIQKLGFKLMHSNVPRAKSDRLFQDALNQWFERGVALGKA